MKFIKYIPVSIFILIAAIWDIWAPGIDYKEMIVPANMVNWCIFYYTMVYLAWFIYCIIEAIKTDYIYFGALGIGIGVRICTELNRIGMTYTEYAHSVDDYQSRVLLVGWACLTLLIPVVRWKK